MNEDLIDDAYVAVNNATAFIRDARMKRLPIQMLRDVRDTVNKLDDQERNVLSERMFSKLGDYQIDVVAICTFCGLPVPESVALKFATAYRRVPNYEVGSWDEAFGKPHKNKNLPQMRRHKLLSTNVFARVLALNAFEGVPLNDTKSGGEGALNIAAREFNISRSTAAKLYYDQRNFFKARKRARENDE